MSTGYVNQGPDRRAGGALGRVLAWVQRASAFKTGREPRFVIVRGCGGSELMLAVNRRYPAPYLSLFIKRKTTPYLSLRIGWRYDRYWGDERTVGYNPQPDIIGGCFLDVILKGTLRQIVHY